MSEERAPSGASEARGNPRAKGAMAATTAAP